ncbi:MAG: hypothetical protein MZU97_19325 [Bacillus subtilis]|nr:hypothetical protein [Bacillus subtilis]
MICCAAGDFARDRRPSAQDRRRNDRIRAISNASGTNSNRDFKPNRSLRRANHRKASILRARLSRIDAFNRFDGKTSRLCGDEEAHDGLARQGISKNSQADSLSRTARPLSIETQDASSAWSKKDFAMTKSDTMIEGGITDESQDL